MNEDKIRKIFKKYGLFSKQDRRNYDFYNKAIEELSNLMRNQDKIDCYDKTGEIISNDKGEVIAEGIVGYTKLLHTHEWTLGGKGLDDLYCTLEENVGKQVKVILQIDK